MSVMIVAENCWIPSTDADGDGIVVMQQQRQNRNKKRRVSFCCCYVTDCDDHEQYLHPVTDVIEVTHKYPSDYFYTRSDVAR